MSRFKFETKICRDILYGNIVIPIKFLLHVIDKYEFQILGSRKQLGTIDMIYRSAHHTRFEHSLGVFELSKRFVTALLRQKGCFQVESFRLEKRISDLGFLKTEENLNVFLVSSLIHDIGNFPFCHQFEGTLGVEVPNSEQVGSMIIRGVLKGWPFMDDNDLERLQLRNRRGILADIINSRSKDDLLSPFEVFVKRVINGPYGIDFLDYVYRDAFQCTLRERSLADFLVDHALVLCPKSSNQTTYQLAFSHHVLHELRSLAQLRLDLERKVYSNKTHRIITSMLLRAIEVASEDAEINLGELHMYTDEGLLSHLKECSRSKKFIESIRSRRLYEIVHRFDSLKPGVDPIVRRALEIWGKQQLNELRKRIGESLGDVGIDEEHILLSFPSSEYRTCKEGEVLVANLETEQVDYLSDLEKYWIEEYQREYRDLSKYLVLLSEDAKVDKKKVSDVINSNFVEWVRDIHGIKRLTVKVITDKVEMLSPTQTKILGLLLGKAYTASQLGIKMHRTRSTISYHLNGLRRIGFVEEFKRGRQKAFTISPQYEPYIKKKLNMID